MHLHKSSHYTCVGDVIIWAIVVVNSLGIKKQESHIIYVQKNVTT